MDVPAGVSPALVAFGIGVALAGAPGPVQAVLLTEAVRGGVGRGLRAMAGASLTFGSLLALLAVGFSISAPSVLLLRLLKIAGGALLIWLAADAIRPVASSEQATDARRGLPPPARGSLAVLLNPGAWLFLAAVASPLIATANQSGGTGAALLAAAALMVGAATGDTAIVILGGTGLRRAGPEVGRWIRRALSVLLGSFGVWLILSGLLG